MTPEVRLIMDYNDWLFAFLASGAAVDLAKLEAELRPFITKDTVLNEPASIPWGGAMVGYEGWARFFRESAPTLAHFAGRHDMAEPVYYQNGNVVLRESSITIKGAAVGAPAMLFMTEIEKYTVEDGRIVQIDAFYDDTASFLDLLAREGVAAR